MTFDLKKAMDNEGLCRVKTVSNGSSSWTECKIVYTEMSGLCCLLVVAINEAMIFRFSEAGSCAPTIWKNEKGQNRSTIHELHNILEEFNVWVTISKPENGEIQSVVHRTLDDKEYYMSHIERNGYVILSESYIKMKEGEYYSRSDEPVYVHGGGVVGQNYI